MAEHWSPDWDEADAIVPNVPNVPGALLPFFDDESWERESDIGWLDTVIDEDWDRATGQSLIPFTSRPEEL